MSALSVVTGAGPVGRTVAEQLAETGQQVRVLTRSGSGPEHPNVERVALDVRDEQALRRAVAGADAVFHCIHAAYTASAWQAVLPTAEQAVLRAAAGAVVVFPESLYSYADPSRPMTEDGPRTATGGKRGVRTALLAGRARSATPTVSVVASDYFGPYARAAHAGERMVPAILSGRTVRVLGSLDQPHSFTYLPDYARAMIQAAAAPATWGSVLHAPTGPALTQRELVHAFAAAAAVRPRTATLPSWLLRSGALVPGPLRELAETLYQFTGPFVVDSTRTQAVLGLAPTPVEEAARATVAWWRDAGRVAVGRRASRGSRDGQHQGQHRPTPRLAQDPRRLGERPAGVDEVVDQQDRAAVQHHPGRDGEGSVDGAQPLRAVAPAGAFGRVAGEREGAEQREPPELGEPRGEAADQQRARPGG